MLGWAGSLSSGCAVLLHGAIGLGSSWIHFGSPNKQQNTDKFLNNRNAVFQRSWTYFMCLVRIASNDTFWYAHMAKLLEETDTPLNIFYKVTNHFKESHSLITIHNPESPHSYSHKVYYFPKYKLWREKEVWTILGGVQIFLQCFLILKLD